MDMFDKRWEKDVYAKGRQLNQYPYDFVVSFVMSNFAGCADRGVVTIGEVGSGAGNNLWFLAREGFQARGIDGSESAVAYANERFLREGLDVSYTAGDFSKLPWADNSCDAIIDRMAVTHNRRVGIESVLDEVKRCLKPGGLFCSQAFAVEHDGRMYGVGNGDGSFEAFSDGYFKDIARTFFFSSQDIDELIGSRLVLEIKQHVVSTNELDGSMTAQYDVVARKPY